MFTGIVEELGSVVDLVGPRLRIACRTVSQDSPIGASIAVNGVCLTLAGRVEEELVFDLSEETLRRTALGRLRPADPVDLERPATLATRVGGHLAPGHVDAAARGGGIEPTGRAKVLACR